ncbi:hypothetical protein [Telmatospirillum sp.]|uniref:hypothetical protein n=1 Tax=Telmatospirillum sp. TaxID=2079197 RepID=UPI002850E450|nr:hypothetical protein [Telmatospirillum sp.]MDR3438081.1 hypothetical protein [Telmatospirillum sp.]
MSVLLRSVAVLVIALVARPAWAQHLAGGASPDVSIVRIIAALVISLMAGAGLVLMRRRFPARTGPGQALAAFAGGLARARRINVIEARRISAHADVCLVQCGDDEYLILCGPAGSTVLRSGPVAPSPPTDMHGEGSPR